MAFTNAQIRDFINSPEVQAMGAAERTTYLQGLANQYGVPYSRIEDAMGWGSGSIDRVLAQQTPSVSSQATTVAAPTVSGTLSGDAQENSNTTPAVAAPNSPYPVQAASRNYPFPIDTMLQNTIQQYLDAGASPQDIRTAAENVGVMPEQLQRVSDTMGLGLQADYANPYVTDQGGAGVVDSNPITYATEQDFIDHFNKSGWKPGVMGGVMGTILQDPYLGALAAGVMGANRGDSPDGGFNLSSGIVPALQGYGLSQAGITATDAVGNAVNQPLATDGDWTGINNDINSNPNLYDQTTGEYLGNGTTTYTIPGATGAVEAGTGSVSTTPTSTGAGTLVDTAKEALSNPIVQAVGGALLNDGGNVDTTTTTSSIPPEFMPYFTGQNGVYPLAQQQYLDNIGQGYIGMTPAQRQAIDASSGALVQYAGSGAYQNALNAGNDLLTGGQNVDLSPVSNVNDPNQVNPALIDRQAIQQSFGALGPNDPTNSLNRLMTGQVDNPQLGGMYRSILNDSSQAYDDMLRNLETTVLPQTRSSAMQAGQYGGSRQGIVEGLIGEQAARNARDLAIQNTDAGVNLYGNAYENAQNRMGQTTNALASQAVSAASQNAQSQNQANQFNVGNQMTTDQFNANLGLQNNNQRLAQGAFNVGNLSTGSDLLNKAGTNAQTMSNNAYLIGAQGQQDAQAGQQYGWDQLANYANIVQNNPSRTQSTTQPGMSDWEAAQYAINIGQGLSGLFK